MVVKKLPRKNNRRSTRHFFLSSTGIDNLNYESFNIEKKLHEFKRLRNINSQKIFFYAYEWTTSVN